MINKAEQEAKRIAHLLEGVHAAVICGPDISAAASVALALAHIHGATRRVAIADLAGEAAPLNALVSGPDDDPHGISDSFLYGVSLNKIARPIDDAQNIFLMPAGTEAVALEGVYRNERWRRLSAGFEQAGALLLIVAVKDVPGFDALCQYVGAVVPIGKELPMALPGVQNLWLEPPPPPPETIRKVVKARQEAAVDRGQRQSRLLASLAAAAALVVIVLAFWPNISNTFGRPEPIASADSTVSDSAPASIDSAIPAVPESNTRTTERPAPRSITTPVVGNPQDSSVAALFAVYFVAANTIEEAKPPARVDALSAVAISPVRIGSDGARWFRVTVGAGSDSAQAEALLKRLRDASQIGANSGSIIRVPYAFKVEEGLTPESSAEGIARWSRKGIRAYALRQNNGSVTLFTGAFQTPAQAALLADSLQSVGISPSLVYRTGRTFQ